MIKRRNTGTPGAAACCGLRIPPDSSSLTLNRNLNPLGAEMKSKITSKIKKGAL